MTPEMHGKIRDYLLGRVSDADREEIEKTMLTDDSAFEEVTIAESELVDDYLSGDLPPEDRLKAEQNFLNHLDTSQDFRFARTLQRYIKSNPVSPNAGFRTIDNWWKRPSILRASAVLGILVVLLGSIWLVWTRRNQPERLFAVTLTLSTSERDQGAKATSVRIPSNVDAVKLYLPLPDQGSDTYAARLVSADGEEGLKVGREGQSAVVIIPTARLHPGAYALQLQKQMPNGSQQRVPGSYFFKVE